MSESFEMLLNRDKNLGHLSNKASDLRESSKKIRKEAHNLKMSMWFRKYMTPIIIVAVLIFLFLLKWFLF